VKQFEKLESNEKPLHKQPTKDLRPFLMIIMTATRIPEEMPPVLSLAEPNFQKQ
jgi:hypothetical protein